MTEIVKGGNLPLSGEPMRVAVVRRSGGPGAPEVDAAALLVDSGGKVRGRGDLVFYNQPEHAGSGVRLVGSAQGEGGVVADWLEIDPGRVEPSVERIVVAASCDGGTFGEVADLYLRAVSAATGEQLVLYAVGDATTETAILLGEFYRRNGGWKFRAVGQGYASGLPGLAADFGFSAPDDQPAPQPPAPLRPAPVPAPAPPTPVPPPHAVAKVEGPGASAASAAPSGVYPGSRNALPDGIGPDFPHLEYMGRGKEDIDTGLTLPRGFLVVDVMKKGDAYVEVVTLTIRKRRWRSVMSSRIENLRGVGLVYNDGHSPLRLRVDTRGQWMIRIRPVSTLRAFDGPVEGFGPDVLAHVGDEVDVRYRYQGDEDKEGYFGVSIHRRGGQWEYAFSRRDRGRGSGSLPRGPRLLVIEADGGWSMEPRPPGSGGFWSRRR
ncbi:TerD family protein [Streptomyces palmae]|uniref:TerD family protein n=1 Tax=Streptomyces palmae TaxID=1701085 RepID=A0A4Z0HCF8_9ACTN|nr:TerD family protein [Streptomyces palmae]TGB17389.1 TerD family protein [Streptomyces palmae]